MIGATDFATVREVYEVIDSVAPFSFAQDGDNVGLLVGEFDAKVSKILISLDITSSVVHEAAKKGAELIISHHPIIYHPLKALSTRNPAVLAAKLGISAICAHSNLDVARGGVNDCLSSLLGIEKSNDYLEEMTKSLVKSNIFGLGNICTLPIEMTSKQLAEKLKAVLGCEVVRYTDRAESIRRVAVCSGSGGYLVDAAIDAGLDGLISGDIKHDRFVAAKNADFALFDAGHFHTERVVLPFLKQILCEKFPRLIVEIAQNSDDLVCYIK